VSAVIIHADFSVGRHDRDAIIAAGGTPVTVAQLLAGEHAGPTPVRATPKPKPPDAKVAVEFHVIDQSPVNRPAWERYARPLIEPADKPLTHPGRFVTLRTARRAA